jgi:hypothetical protein
MKTLTLKDTTTLLAILALTGCTPERTEPTGTPELRITEAVSACGGFEAPALSETDSTGAYCDAEVLRWEYDAASRTLELLDARALLNCCGERHVTLDVVDGVYVVTESDEPEGTGGRCDCMCVFDLGLTAEGVPDGVIPLRLLRHVTDEGGEPALLWEGDIDLGEGTGAVVIDPSDVGMWCQDPAAPPAVEWHVSECGGAAEYRDTNGDSYCEAERLRWEHDAATGTLELVNTRVLLNCCGERSIEVEVVDGMYVITENDLPLGGEPGGRCNCMCVFDFILSIESVPAGVAGVRLERDEGEGAAVVWQGEIDLNDGSGSQVVDSSEVGAVCEEPGHDVSYNAEVSDCGGFPTDDDGGYCDAEVLDWTYNEAERTLALTDSRALLNCCGDHGIAITLEDGVYVVAETDAPTTGGSRCDCLCVFDFALTASDIPSGRIPLRLTRHVTDEADAPSVVWEGEIDLGAGSGSVVLDTTDAGMWCSE